MKTLLALSLAGVMFGLGGCAVYAEPGVYVAPAPAAVVVQPSYYYGPRHHSYPQRHHRRW